MTRISRIFWMGIIIGMGLFLPAMADASHSAPPPSEGALEAQVIELVDVAGILESHSQKMLNDRRKRVEVREIRGFERIVLPAGSLSYDVSVPEQVYRGGTVPVTIQLLVNGREIKKIRLTAQFHLFADVLVARSTLRRHHVIQEKDLQRVNKDISLLATDAVIDAEEIVGKRTTLNMNSQEVFRRGMVERAPLVKKGDRVTLMIENSQFRITSLGEAQEEGGRGDRIRLLNVTSKREVYGRVLDGNTAQIDY